MSEARRVVVGVGAVVVRSGRLLMVERGRPPGQGTYSMPGGKLVFGETLKQCAERECLEETGVVVRAKETGFHCFSLPVSDTLQYVIVDIEAEYVSGEPVAGDDAAKALWVDRKMLDALPMGEDTRQFLEMHKIRDRLT